MNKRLYSSEHGESGLDTSISEEELKPCPFCGSEARINDDCQHWGAIYCNDCGACMPSGGLGVKQAIQAWNRREG